MKRLAFLVPYFLLFSLISACRSVDRYNAHIDSEISIKKQLKDIDYIQKKLIKNHPKLDLYTAQSQVDLKFDSLKKTITRSIKPNDFFLKTNAIIAQLKHGHTDVYPLYKKNKKSEVKRLKNTIGPFSQITTFWQNDSLYVVQATVKDSVLKPGANILAVDGISPQQLKEKYQAAVYGDGENKTYLENRLNRTFFNNYYLLENGLKDSINVDVLYKGKKYKTVVKRFTKPEEKKKEKPSKKDSVKQPTSNKPKTNKLKLYNFSFNKTTKAYARSLSFPTNDSTFAVLKINTFSYGNFKKDYQSIFKIIADYKVKNLVLDLRNNGGGRLVDAYQLFAYLCPNQDEFLTHQIIKSPSSFKRTLVDISPKYLKPIVFPVSYLAFLLTKKNKANEYEIKPSLSCIKTSSNPADAYHGNLYVMINGGSYSASATISANLKGLNRAFFVGEETGGDANGTVAGLMPNYQLPNSKLKFTIGTIYLTPKYYQTDTIGHGIYPNQVIKTTLNDKLNRVDPQLKWIVKDVKNNNAELKKVVKQTSK